MTASENNRVTLTPRRSGAPLLSVVTVVRNGERYLEETIQSVIAHKDIQYIIIDGASTDDTVSIIKKYDEHIDFWVSESDRGIYEAMNKGINLAAGECVALLNCGDVYEQGTLDIVSEKVMQTTEKHYVIAGGVSMIDSVGEVSGVYIPDNNSLDNKFRYMPLNHPAMFVSRAVYRDIATYNAELKIAADYEFVLTLLDQKVGIIFMESILTRMRSGGISESPKSIGVRLKESFRIRRKYSGLLYCSLISLREVLSFFRVLLSGIRISRIFS